MKSGREHMAGNGGFYGDLFIPYMDVNTPKQFVEYCGKVEKFDMSLEAAEYILEFEKGIGGRFYVKRDVLYVVYREGSTHKTGYKTDLFEIRKRLEEEISCCEHFLSGSDDEYEKEMTTGFLMEENKDILDETVLALEWEKEEAAKCKLYHQLFDDLWNKLGPAKSDTPYEAANLTWEMPKSEE